MRLFDDTEEQRRVGPLITTQYSYAWEADLAAKVVEKDTGLEGQAEEAAKKNCGKTCTTRHKGKEHGRACFCLFCFNFID